MLNKKDSDNFYIKEAAKSTQAAEDYSAEYDYAEFNSPDYELDGIRDLVEMAKEKKIDPWNIDITSIADKYMLHLAENSRVNLRLSSRAWLFLAILLKMKSDVLEGINPIAFEDAPDDNFAPDEGGYYEEPAETPDYYGDKVISIKDILQRRTSVKLNRKRTVTLKDLIRQLEFYEQLDRKEALQKRLDQTKRKVSSFKNLSSKDIINLAQEDYITPALNKIKERLSAIFEKEEKAELSEFEAMGLNRMTAYLALLFLSRDGGCNLEQEEFYSDLYVTKSEQMLPDAAAGNNHGLEIWD